MFYSSTLPEKIVKKLTEKGICKQEEGIIAFYDDTMFLTGNKGVVCTEKEIITYNSTAVTRFNLNDVRHILFREIDKQKYIYKMILIKNDGAEIDITPGSIPNDEMHLLVDVINFHRSNK